MRGQHYQVAEAALSVLGSVMLAGAEVYHAVRDLCPPAAFADPGHAAVMAAMAELVAEGVPPDLVATAARMERAGTSARIGGWDGLEAVAEASASAVNVQYHARIVHEAWQARVARETLVAAVKALDGGTPRTEAIGPLVRSLQEGLAAGAGGAVGFSALLMGAINDLRTKTEAAAAGDVPDIGVHTGLKDVDRILGAMEPKQLLVLAGRPAMGKSALAMGIAQHVARTHTVLIFSLEMAAPLIVRRMLASESRVPGEKLKTGLGISSHDLDAILYAVNVLAPLHLLIDDQSADLDSIVAECHRAAHSPGPPLGLIVIDYMQLMAGSTAAVRGRNREQEVAGISRALKRLASTLGVPVLALSQLSRGVESRPNKRPLLSDLRESGAIEQDADVVLFVYRDEYYHPDTEDQGVAEVIAAKVRDGQPATAKVAFNNKIVRFSDLTGRPDNTGRW